MGKAGSAPVGRKISMQDGRLVISTAKSTRFIGVFAIVFVIGVVMWAVGSSFRQEFAKAGSHRDAIGMAAIIVIGIVVYVVRRRRILPQEGRVIVRGEVFVFDRQKDELLRNDDLLAPLSSVKMVQVDAHPQYGLSISRGFSVDYSPSVVILAEGGEVVWRLATTSKGEARKIAEAIAEYTGAQISEV
jgi:hypothetical protein